MGDEMTKTKSAISRLRFLLLGYGALHAAAIGAQVYPLEYFALREVVNNVTVSPDGERVAMLKILSRTGDPILHIYDSDDMDADPLVVDADPMEIVGYRWASDRHVVLQFRQQVRNRLQGQEGSVFGYRLAVLDVIDETFDDFETNTAPQIENVLQGKPNEIIVSEREGIDNSVGVREAFRPRAYYTVNLERGTKQLLIRGRFDLARIYFDSDGNPRVARGFDIGTRDYLVYYRDPGENSWREVYRWTEDQFEGFFFEEVIGLDDSVPGNILMLALNGDDKLGLWSFNPETKTFDELIYRRSDVDVYGVRYHSNSWTYPDRVTAVSYFKDNLHFEYFDEIEGATFNQLEQLVPHAHYVSISSRSREGDTMVVRNVGPRDPGTYYLLHNGEFEFLGSTQPLLDSDELADVEYIQYTARDGRPMATFVTIPNTGEPPYPTVVMPHGGPFVREFVLFDEWAQMLANNGYMVVQPQFRMSLGYGFDHFMSSIVDEDESGLMVSQAGRKMQDDKDDAALHLVEMGLADPDRMAMYGWSYGGYAALIAASRTPQNLPVRHRRRRGLRLRHIRQRHDAGARAHRRHESPSGRLSIWRGATRAGSRKGQRAAPVDPRQPGFPGAAQAGPAIPGRARPGGQGLQVRGTGGRRPLLQHALLRAPDRALHFDYRLPSERLRQHERGRGSGQQRELGTTT